MKKLFYKIISFLSIIVVYKIIILLFFVFKLSSKNSNDFYGEISEKSKLILVGSSNLDYNYDYSEISREFPNYNVIGNNLSEPSGLYALIFKLKRLNPSKDDIIVFSLPHSLYEADKFLPIGSFKKSGFSVALLKESFKNFPLESFQAMSSLKLMEVYNILNARIDKENLNDSILNFQKTPKIHNNYKYKNCEVSIGNDFNIQSISYDKEYLEKIQVFINNEFDSKIFFRYPALKKDDFLVNKERLDFLNKHFSFLDDFENAIYIEKYWFNQWYHLNACGRDLNTEKLILELKQRL